MFKIDDRLRLNNHYIDLFIKTDELKEVLLNKTIKDIKIEDVEEKSSIYYNKLRKIYIIKKLKLM